MELASLWGGGFDTTWLDELMVWGVAAVAASIALVAIVNVLDMVLDTDTETG